MRDGDTEPTYFIAWDCDHNVWGYGDSEDDALSDAREHIRQFDADERQDLDNALMVSEATGDLVKRIRYCGWESVPMIEGPDGVMRLER